MTALGFIETKGLLAAIEGADAMLKAANVCLLEKNLAGGGLVTISIAGEVSAVQASVEAGVAAIGRIHGATVISKHVIARPDEGVARVIAIEKPAEPVEVPAEAAVVEELPVEDFEAQEQEAPVEEAPEEAVSDEETVAEEPEAVEPVIEEVVEVAPEEIARTAAPKYHFSELKKLKVSKLRQIARTLGEITLTKAEIKFANKKTLIEAITKVTGR